MNTLFSFLSGLALLLWVQGCASSVQRTNVQPAQSPQIMKACDTCHLPHAGAQAGKILLKKPLSTLCLDCHPGRKAPAEHAIDVIPSMSTGTLPLSGGKIACTTCHDPHANRYGKMLRVPASKLCIACHKK